MLVENVGWGRGHVLDHRPGRRQPRSRAFEQVLGIGAGIVPGRGAAKTDARRRPGAVDRTARLHQKGRADQRQIIEAAANQAQRIEIVALHLNADATEFAKAGLVADHAAERRRADRRTAGLGAKADRHLEIGDRGGRAARRAPWGVRRVVRMHGFARVPVGEFGRHRLPEDDAARRPGQRDAGSIGKGPVATVDRRAVLGRHVIGVDDVLDPDRHALQHSRPAGPIDRARLAESEFGVEPDPGLN